MVRRVLFVAVVLGLFLPAVPACSNSAPSGKGGAADVPSNVKGMATQSGGNRKVNVTPQ